MLTFDVESHTIELNKEDLETVRRVHNEALPSLLDLLSKHDIPGTFYFTGKFAEESPESIEMIMEGDHEIGCHGYDHSSSNAFDLLNYEQQKIELSKAKKAIEPVGGKVKSFRAPALRINKYTARALEKSGFETDSSISSQRFDGPFTFGAKKKMRWLIAPRKPYYLSYESPVKKGDSKVLEIPISALLFPFIGTTMRISPTLTKVIRKVLFYESKITSKPIVFLFHPNECLDIKRKLITTRRSDNLLHYLFADLIRQRLKTKNHGICSLNFLEELIVSAKHYGFDFLKVNEFNNNFEELR
jgi:peptidoglycan/xylan/chitin deacetylase (PgdA/CDA1 family)